MPLLQSIQYKISKHLDLNYVFVPRCFESVEPLEKLNFQASNLKPHNNVGEEKAIFPPNFMCKDRD
jgi:hypothetical protein